MKLFVVALAFLVSSSRHRCSTADKNAEFMFWKSGASLPGPSMAFDECLGAGTFEFEFKTFVKRALLLYQDDYGFSDYIELTLQDGKIYLAFLVEDAQLSGNRRDWWFRSEKRYNDFEWHKVKIVRSWHKTSIYVDDESKTFVTWGRSTFTSELQIGGFPPKRNARLNEISKQDAWRIYILPMDKRGYFNGCVKNIKYGGKNKQSLKPKQDIKSLRYFVKDGCDLTYCHKPEPVCKNRGKCSPIDGKIEVACDCRWTGFEGANCTIDSLELTLNGSYQVTYQEKDFIITESDNYTFRIKTKEKNAIILHTKSLEGDQDKLTIEIRDSMLTITSNIGNGDVVLKTRKEISDGIWHLIQYNRVGKKLSLSMDGNEKYGEKKKHVGEYLKMDYGYGMYFGKHDHPHEDIKLQDFIWHLVNKKDVNFVRGLYEAINTSSERHYTVTPEQILPIFNRKIHRKFMPSKATVTRPTVAHTECVPREGHSCATTDTPPTTTSLSETKALKSSDDSSVTWIVVVTVICALILFAIIAFLVHKWNSRYSGDFQVNEKEIGPSATIIHYKDSYGYKEKQRQVKT